MGGGGADGEDVDCIERDTIGYTTVCKIQVPYEVCSYAFLEFHRGRLFEQECQGLEEFFARK